ncbi:hypothetical protein [Marinagarivorans cellulosilyticus]|uniref:Lipoprotein n=1 Tax=Marinagarivorans cellulosilyticus TaxID=2721545 RepID=A0AAN1WDY2_9GAMM|nr:hypothetical protein [Marinagarivorans cellulosilyticus]BCD95817.1 hypothetical protein MARGE09_P0016 [Marinagarivorans cellulosilyticus]
MLTRFLVLSTTLLLLAACGDGQLSGLDNAEIAGKRDECVRQNPTSPGRVTACENIRKECERRRKNGNYAC